MPAPSASDFMFALPDNSLNDPNLSPGQTCIVGQLDPGLYPELDLAPCRLHVHMQARFFSRKEEEPVALLDEYGRTHSILFLHRHGDHRHLWHLIVRSPVDGVSAFPAHDSTCPVAYGRGLRRTIGLWAYAGRTDGG